MKAKVLFTAVLFIFSFLNQARSQITYCSPTFPSGCSSWRNQSVTLDSIVWTIGSTSCTISDYTHLKTTIAKGVTKQMTVINGNWCGCGVWIDFDSDGMFSDTENMYYSYQAASTQTYTFNITIPTYVNPGTYRMRVIAGWGTDCFTNGSSNGFGACGSYQYGNFDDFTIKVVDPFTDCKCIDDETGSTVEIFPNPAKDIINVKTVAEKDLPFKITNIHGKVVKLGSIRPKQTFINIYELAPGVYFLNFDNKSNGSYKIIKQ